MPQVGYSKGFETYSDNDDDNNDVDDNDDDNDEDDHHADDIKIDDAFKLCFGSGSGSG